MAVDFLSAANAYRNQMKMMQGVKDTPESDESQQSPFLKMVESAIHDSVDVQSKAESTELQALSNGKTELTDLVTAVASAELSLTTVVAIRDRVINAYNDIVKMPI